MAIHGRHPDVRNDDVIVAVLRGLEGLQRIIESLHVGVFHFQQHLQDVHDVSRVFHQQDFLADQTSRFCDGRLFARLL
ncbi:hypothetical protein D3C80_2176320 [compost metagenome]